MALHASPAQAVAWVGAALDVEETPGARMPTVQARDDYRPLPYIET